MNNLHLSPSGNIVMDAGTGSAPGCIFSVLAWLRAEKGSSLRPIPSARCHYGESSDEESLGSLYEWCDEQKDDAVRVPSLRSGRRSKSGVYMNNTGILAYSRAEIAADFGLR